MDCRGVIFDLFHTLTGHEHEWSSLPTTFDVLGVDRAAWNDALLVKSRSRLVGEERDPYAIMRSLAKGIDASIPEELIRRATDVRIQRFEGALRQIPAGNLEVLHALRRAGLRLALLSNADAMEAAPWPDSPLRGLFDVEAFSCDIGCAKPEPESFRHCLQALALDPGECVFVGDGGSGELDGAKAVGLRTVFYSGVIGGLLPAQVAPRAATADHHIRSMSELPRILGINATLLVE